MKLSLPLGVLLAVIAGSYLTLVLADSDTARHLMFPYASVEFVLAVLNILNLERRLPHGVRAPQRPRHP